MTNPIRMNVTLPPLIETKHMSEATPDPDDLYDAATQLKDEGNLEGAVEALLKIIADHPEHVQSHLALGVHLQKLGRNDDAIRHASKVTELDPQDAFSYVQLSVIMQRCGKSPKPKTLWRALMRSKRQLANRRRNGLAEWITKAGMQLALPACVQTFVLRTIARLGDVDARDPIAITRFGLAPQQYAALLFDLPKYLPGNSVHGLIANPLEQDNIVDLAKDFSLNCKPVVVVVHDGGRTFPFLAREGNVSRHTATITVRFSPHVRNRIGHRSR